MKHGEAIVKICDRERRQFLKTVSLFMTVPFFSVFTHAEEQKKQEEKKLIDLFKPDEYQKIKQSPMAMELEKYFGKGYT